MLYKIVLFITFVHLFQNTWAYSEYVENYVLRVKQSNSPPLQLKIFSKRIALDIKNKNSLSETSFACAENIYKISPKHFRAELLNIINHLKKNGTSASENEKTFFIELINTTSSEDVYSAYIDSLLEVFPEMLLDFFPVLLKNKQTKLFLLSFEKNKSRLLSNDKNKIPIIQFYCLSATLNGVSEKCVSLVRSAEPSFQKSWQHIATISAYLSANRINEAKKILNGFFNGTLVCQKLTTSPWINYFTAQVHRIDGDYERSLSCLEAFKASTNLDDQALFFYNLESAKSNYKKKLEKSNLHLQNCDNFISKKNLNNTFFSLILKIEKIKYNHLMKNIEESKKLLAESLSEIEINNLTPYSYTLKLYKSSINNKDEKWKQDKKCSDYFECIDFMKTIL